MNIFWIDDRLCGSSSLHDDDCAQMLQQGIKGVVSLRRTALPTNSCICSSFKYCHIPVNPNRRLKVFLIIKILKYLQFIRQVDGRVLTFCFQGCNRTCAFMACYLVSEYGINSREAITRLLSTRKCAFTSCPFSSVVNSFGRFLKAPMFLKIFFIF